MKETSREDLHGAATRTAAQEALAELLREPQLLYAVRAEAHVATGDEGMVRRAHEAHAGAQQGTREGAQE